MCAPDFSSAAVGDTLTMTVDLYYDPVSTNQKETDTLTYNIASSTDPLLVHIFFQYSTVRILKLPETSHQILQQKKTYPYLGSKDL